MEKLNYNDFNKFLVSLGVILIGLSLLIPWLFLKESYNLPTKIEINALTEIAKNLIETKQIYLVKLTTLIPWICITFIFSGMFLVIFGLVRWYRKQLLIDKKDNLDIIKLEKEIQIMTPIEIVDKAQKETRDDSISQLLQSDEITLRKNTILSQSEHPWKKYIKIERIIADKIIEFNPSNYDILPNVKVGLSEIDILFKSKNPKYFDKIIEIKYYKSGLRRSFINMITSNLRSTIEMYNVKVRRDAIPTVLLVLRSDSEDYLKIPEVEKYIQDSGKEWGLKHLRVEFIKEEELNEYNFAKLLDTIKK